MNFDEWWATLTPQEHRVLGESNARFVWESAVGECMKEVKELSQRTNNGEPNAS